MRTFSKLDKSGFVAACEKVGFETDFDSEGSVLVTTKVGYLSLDSPSAKIRRHRQVAVPPGIPTRFYIAGRDRIPPTKGLAKKDSTESVRYLSQNRFATTDSLQCIQELVDFLRAKGWCTRNDIYVIPSHGKWLMYVSHHDETIIDIR